MDYETYRRKYFTDPVPEQRFGYSGISGATLFFAEYEQATGYYQQVLGPPAYVEGEWTRGWQIGDTWLTLLKGKSGNPRNIEVMIVMQSPQDAERLQAAFIAAGGTGDSPSDQLMYTPVRSCPVTDPFGTQIMIFSPIETQTD